MITPCFDKTKLATLPSRPGVYRMLDPKGQVIYVGKAKNLKKRVSSYFVHSAQQSPKVQRLLLQLADIEITVTQTEQEALILESTLIKQYQPRYNVLLRDDKSYPYLFLSADPFPRLSLHRGAKRPAGRYFGPYPHAHAVYDSLRLLQKLFPIRQCDNRFFQNRSRPCLQYQIKRCTAPCVGLISEAAYQVDVQHTVLFLQGRSQQVMEALMVRMNTAAQALEYEQAAKFRDQISLLRRLQAQQIVSTDDDSNIDIIAIVQENDTACLQLLTIRHGQQLGSRAYFPKQTRDQTTDDILTAFLSQYYLNNSHDIPEEIVCPFDFSDRELFARTLSHHYQKTIRVTLGLRGIKQRWLAMAETNARVSVEQHRPSQYRDRLAALSIALQLDSMPQRLECFDISHSLGEATVASCVVFDAEGACPRAYRRFNIRGVAPGDDLAALAQAVTRHYTRVAQQGADYPDVLLIDGGRLQINKVKQALADIDCLKIRLFGVAKGEKRLAGLEAIILPDEEKPLLLPSDSPALHLIQQIRDEAHRFAITTHRKQRAKQRQQSLLESIPGIGQKRRQQLIRHFGGLQGVTQAGVDDLAKVPGISRQLAEKIYAFFLKS
ncbi:excinuclease ABC subunit UvrC [Thioflexithrix psekupsensis]|uniref:UvrABC system protein C n=1 Tax=Thioflexithrix psekupsensis TaxID=1570016 RepID=A0A251XAP7_9GAMM|nr:excinuclease ABC subunit UvrC [Thioflexithrix psekupsensis]OUD15449.1 excinuclease ABC subunit C [Thioflexithrix psekupsensis]